MNIVVDAKVTAAREQFAAFGNVRCLPAEHINRATLHDADALIVRSVTPVDDVLLDGTAVRFVGTATAGTDHVDLDALHRRGITFADAAGANASAVTEYVTTVICQQLLSLEVPRAGHRVGIVGYGHVGRRLASSLRGLGLAIDVCDAPLAEQHPTAGFRSIDDVFERCNIVTLHTSLVDAPLQRHGTRHLIDASRLAAWNVRDGLLINTSRGAVVNQASLLGADLGHVRFVFDVWEGEPDAICWDLLGPDGPNIVLATPHIAGYTLDAKLEATRRIAIALGRFCGSAPPMAMGVDPAPPVLLETSDDGFASLHACLTSACPLADDDAAMRRLAGAAPEERAQCFASLRPGTPTRRCFAGRRISGGRHVHDPWRSAATWLGFEFGDG